MTETLTVHDVVAFLLAKAGSHLSMSAIHRMAYFAQGWHLAWEDAPLFAEEIRARESGAVIPALYPLQKDGYLETEGQQSGCHHQRCSPRHRVRL